MAHILTIQSHVVYGHAGNAAAAFPLQRLGHKTSILNLLQFSNHTGYGKWGGKAICVEELEEVLAGLNDVGVYEELDCIITGYLGSQEQVYALAKFIKAVKAVNPNVFYCCDPVIGDEHTGMYVKQEVADVINDELVSIADLITPNRYELAKLTKSDINSVDDILELNKTFLTRGTRVLATSSVFEEAKTGMLFQEKENEYLTIEMPLFDINYTVRGTGDVVAAVFMGNYFLTNDFKEAMQKTANTMHGIVKYTSEYDLPELAIIQNQELIVTPGDQYCVEHHVGATA